MEGTMQVTKVFSQLAAAWAKHYRYILEEGDEA